MEPFLDRLPYAEREKWEQRIPALRTLRLQYIELCDAYARAALSGDDLAEMELRLQSFQQELAKQQQKILESNGIDAESLQPGYSCPLCQDTGIVLENGVKRPCSCSVEQQQKKRDNLFAKLPCFSDFNNALFSDHKQLHNARRLHAELESFTLNFPYNKKPNLLIFGSAGLGKTFFIGCLTRALHERGIRCEMRPAYDLFDSFRRQHLGEANVLYKYSALPFLAIDDLGTEPMYRNITVEYFNKLLDRRIEKKLHTAITTNLDEIMLRERYGERIASRLHDQRLFDIIGLRGKDLRKSPR